ncbi:hypothetical protein FGO68_gene7997 [Halteria grandinella]|uniref:Uncharacterized protein n=1 Tax=Halteria grandinella TaxID=5974 RepID=A0A8J8T9C6_HALGN|nr:hypothetical protein FGO68_gene7997 [Halteria grandinella]
MGSQLSMVLSKRLFEVMAQESREKSEAHQIQGIPQKEKASAQNASLKDKNEKQRVRRAEFIQTIQTVYFGNQEDLKLLAFKMQVKQRFNDILPFKFRIITNYQLNHYFISQIYLIINCTQIAWMCKGQDLSIEQRFAFCSATSFLQASSRLTQINNRLRDRATKSSQRSIPSI